MKLLLKIFGIIVSFFVFLSIVLCLFFGYLYYWSNQPYGTETKEVEFEIPKAITLDKLSDELLNAEIISSKGGFRVWAKFFSKFSEFKAGYYRLNLPITPFELSKKFIEGSTYELIKHEVVIPEGYTLKNVIEKFVSHGIGTNNRFYELSTNRDFLDKLNITSNSIEGYLYPAKYTFSKTPNEEEVFKSMTDIFWKRLPQGFENIIASRGLTLYESLIVASLIEAETFDEEEKNMVAEVIWNRISLGMPLGIDAAIIYGIDNFNGNLTKSHLLDSDNPYNLRRIKGLPPTPINSPTISSLKAVIAPTKFGYLYYVVDPEKKTRHVFSKTLEEHNVAVSKLVKSGR